VGRDGLEPSILVFIAPAFRSGAKTHGNQLRGYEVLAAQKQDPPECACSLLSTRLWVRAPHGPPQKTAENPHLSGFSCSHNIITCQAVPSSSSIDAARLTVQPGNRTEPVMLPLQFVGREHGTKLLGHTNLSVSKDL
jgi:hypothetical protein